MKLNRCKCGARPSAYQRTGRRMPHAVVCPECGAGTPWVRTEGIAAVMWNKRTEPTERTSTP